MMNELRFWAAGFAICLSAPAFSAGGESTYKNVCAACHGTGAAGAPKTGNQSAWKKLIAEGQVVLTAHGYVGVRGMPAKGGKPDLTVEEFAAALVWMVNQSGGRWTNPDAQQLQAIGVEIARREKHLAAKKRS